MTSINSLNADPLLYCFSHLTNIKDICSISRVCRRWYLLTRNESVPLNTQRLDRIAFENVSHFAQLPRVRLELKFRVFTIFQSIVIGETEDGRLCVYDPKNGTSSFLDYTPPDTCTSEGRFYTSSDACLYRQLHWNIIDLVKLTCHKIKLRLTCHNHALVGKKLYSWEYLNPLNYRNPAKRKRYERLPQIYMQVYDLESRSSSELTYLTSRRPSISVSGERILLQERSFIYILNVNLEKCEQTTFYNYQFNKVHLFGKKILYENSDEINIKDVGDNNTYGEQEFKIAEKPHGTLHPFFIDGIGWRFFRHEGTYWNRALWFLDNGHLTSINFVPQVCHPTETIN